MKSERTESHRTRGARMGGFGETAGVSAEEEGKVGVATRGVATERQRVRRALGRQPLDRLPIQINYTTALGRRLAEYFDISAPELETRLGNHLLRVDLSFPVRFSPDGLIRYDWWGAGWDTCTEGYWHSFAPLAETTDLGRFAWPNPDDPCLIDKAAAMIAADKSRHFVVPNFGICLFERAWSLRGFDRLLMDLADQPAWVEELLERITETQLVLARRFVAAGVDGGYFGDDYGAQRGMLFSPRIWRQLIKPRLARMFAVFREADLPVILHSDGDIWNILPDLVDIGLTCLNPVQPEVLEHKRLYREFGKHISFYGGVSTQSVLPAGTPAEVQQAALACVRHLAADATGLVFGPSHRMQSDIPPQNVAAMLEVFAETMRPGVP
jgi:uroporphyrinogen decarboxylase